jgi:hypothetical protein
MFGLRDTPRQRFGFLRKMSIVLSVQTPAAPLLAATANIIA